MLCTLYRQFPHLRTIVKLLINKFQAQEMSFFEAHQKFPDFVLYLDFVVRGISSRINFEIAYLQLVGGITDSIDI